MKPPFAKEEDSTSPAEDRSKMSVGVRWGLVVVGVVIFGLALGAWVSDTPPTVSSTKENSSKTTISPPIPAATSTAPATGTDNAAKAPATPTPSDTNPKTTTELNSKTTSALKGRDAEADDAQPEGSAQRVSDTMVVSLAGIGALFLLLAAIGKVPSKIGKDGLEFPAPPAAAVAEFADKAAKEGLTKEPEKLRQAAELFLSHGRRVAKDSPNKSDWVLAAQSSVATAKTSRGDEATAGGDEDGPDARPQPPPPH
jgi:hypothetical protein